MRMSVMRTLCEYIRVRENNAGRNYINYFKDYILPDENKIIKTDKLPCEDDISTILDLSSKAGDDMAYMIFSLVLKCGLTSGEICSMMTNFILYDSNECLCIHFPEKKRLIMRGTTPARRKCRNSEDVIIPVGSIKETTERNIIMLTRQIIIYKRTINLFSIIVSLPHGI